MMKYVLILFIPFFLFASVEKIAFIIGNDRGLTSEVPLKYAGSDAERVFQVISELGGVEEHRSYLLINKDRTEIREALYQVKGQISELKNNGENVAIYFYYSGHADRDNLHINNEKLKIEEIKAFFNDNQADMQIIIVDACYSGNFLRSKGLQLGKKIDVNLDNSLETKGTAIITSSQANEFSHEADILKGSVFTHYFITALRGAADFNRNGKVGLLEAYHYTNNNTRRRVAEFGNQQQSPSFDIDWVGEEDVTVTDLKNGKALLRFQNCETGNYTIISTGHTAGTELYLHDDDTVTLYLPRDNYLIKHETNRMVGIHRVNLAWGNGEIISKNSFSYYPEETLQSKGDKLTFSLFQLLGGITLGKHVLSDEFAFRPTILFRYSFNRFLLGLSGSYSRDQISGDYLSLDRTFIATDLSLAYRIWDNGIFFTDLGFYGGYTYLSQKGLFHNGELLHELELESTKESSTNIWSSGVVGSVTIQLPKRLLFHSSLKPGFRFYRSYEKNISEFYMSGFLGIGLRF